MAIAPRCACQVPRSCVTYTPGQGRHITPTTSAATQNIPFVGPMQHVGSDATPFSIDMVNGKGSVILPFFNLPSWTQGHPLVTPSALRPFRNSLRTKQTYVQPMSQLFFDAQPMNIQAPHGVRIDCQPRAIDTTGVIANGPFIGGGRSFRDWQVVITATGNPGFSGTVKGTAVGRLHHLFG